MAMVGAVTSPISTALFKHESTCSTSSRASQQFSLSPHSRLQFSPSLPSHHRRSSVHFLAFTSAEFRVCQSGLNFITSWHGHSHLGDAVSVLAGRHWESRKGVAGRVHASLLGVGAPEALVIAVVALVVFGPKGLAEVARTLGKSLKAFQPTIQELQQVSREFRSTLEQEIGLDELRNPQPMDRPPTSHQGPQQQSRGENGAPDAGAYTAEDYMRVTQEQVKSLVPEDLRQEAEAAAWGSASPPKTPAQNGTKGVVIESKNSGDES